MIVQFSSSQVKYVYHSIHVTNGNPITIGGKKTHGSYDIGRGEEGEERGERRREGKGREEEGG